MESVLIYGSSSEHIVNFKSRLVGFECSNFKKQPIGVTFNSRQTFNMSEKKLPPVPPKHYAKTANLPHGDKRSEPEKKTNKFGHKFVPEQNGSKHSESELPETVNLCGKLYKKVKLKDQKYEPSKCPKKPLKKPTNIDWYKYNKHSKNVYEHSDEDYDEL